MRKALSALFLCLVISLQSHAQVFPREHGLLNYRLIGFSFPQIPKADKYEIEIAKGDYNIVDSFKKHICQTAESNTFRKILEVPLWGIPYTWRVIYNVGNKKESTVLYHFSTFAGNNIDTNKFHLRIMQQASPKYKNYYVAVDGGGVIYDMAGHSIWGIPDTNGINGWVSDFSFTPDGTITFINGKSSYEINYDAQILWKTPGKATVSGDNVLGEFYHHEFTKLPNGNYMALGMEVVASKPGKTEGHDYFITSDKKENIGHDGYLPGRFSNLIEYDKDSNVVWTWRTLDYLRNMGSNPCKGLDSNCWVDAHANAFFFDEKKKCIYIGFRNLNQIVLVAYPSGKVIRTYSAAVGSGADKKAHGIFCNQHSIGRTSDGYLYVYNNNSCGLRDSLPTVILLEEPTADGGDPKKVWEYTCTIDDYFPLGYPKIFSSGGNAEELPDGSFFVNMGSEYSKFFIVSRDKETQWKGLPERFMETDQKWTSFKEYRAHIITRKELERLIWNAEHIITK